MEERKNNYMFCCCTQQLCNENFSLATNIIAHKEYTNSLFQLFQVILCFYVPLLGRMYTKYLCTSKQVVLIVAADFIVLS